MTTLADLPVIHDDPCPDVVAYGAGPYVWFLHPRRPVPCGVCSRPVRWAWWVEDHHVCGRCRFGPGEDQ